MTHTLTPQHTPRRRFGKIIMYGIIGRSIKILILGVAVGAQSDIMTHHDMLTDLVQQQSGSLLPSYKYINVRYKNINTGDADYTLIQQAIFLNILPNTSQSLTLSRPLTLGTARRFLNKTFATTLSLSGESNQKITNSQRQEFLALAQNKPSNNTPTITLSVTHTGSVELPIKSSLSPIFQDVYTKLKNDLLGSGTISDDVLIQGAIKGMTDAAGDIHTTYFPPTESKNFTDTIHGEFSGIGAYIEMKEPGVLIISSPIEDSPAAKAGIKAGDYILAIDNYTIDKNTDLNKATSKIKGVSGTSVTLTIQRGTETKTFTIVREKIIVKPITTKVLNTNTLLIRINSFSFGTDKARSQALKDAATKGYQTIVIDLRYNPGGSLGDVTHMLDAVVPAGEAAVIIRSRHEKEVYHSQGVEANQSLTNKKVFVLINKQSASASEILAGVIRDYLPQAQIVGETSYGKGSVQTLRDYNDGSSLKITTAKWSTGKSDTNIDGKGIVPDIVVVDDPNTENDEVLDRVKSH